MDPQDVALAAFNDEMRTLLLNALYNASQERRCQVLNLAVNVTSGLLLVLGLFLCKTTDSRAGMLVAGAAAFLAVVGVSPYLSAKRAYYAHMRGKYNCMYVEARDLHRRFATAEASAKELRTQRDEFTKIRNSYADQDDMPSARRIVTLEKCVNELLPLCLLWPDHLLPKE